MCTIGFFDSNSVSEIHLEQRFYPGFELTIQLALNQFYGYFTGNSTGERESREITVRESTVTEITIILLAQIGA